MIYDVMKAFAFSQVDTLILRDPTGHGFLHGLLILAVAWGCWVSYVWAANALRADVGIFRGLHFVALVALTLLGLTLPLAFSGTGLHLRAVVFIASYAVIRLSSAVIVLITNGPAARKRAAVVAAATLCNATLIALSAYQSRTAQILVWCAALAVEITATLVFCRAWQIRCAERFAERFGFIVTAGLEISLGRMAYGMLGQPVGRSQVILIASTMLLIVVLWWYYFDLLSRYTRHRLDQAGGSQRTHIAVISYSLLHLAVIAAMLLIALAMRTMGNDISASGAGLLGLPLKPVWTASLAGGFALYTLAIAAMWRSLGQPFRWVHLAGAAGALLLMPVLAGRPAVAAVLAIGLLALAVGLIQQAVGRRQRSALLDLLENGRADSEGRPAVRGHSVEASALHHEIHAR